MRQMYRAGAFLAIIGLATPPVAHAQSPGEVPAVYQPQIQKFLGARGTALGDAIGSDEYDIEAMYQNPATLTFLRNSSLVVDQRHDYDNHVFGENIAARVFSNRFNAVGIGLGVEHAGKLSKGGLFNFMQEDLDVGYAFRLAGLSSSLSLGVLGNFRLGKDDSASRSAAQFSFGLMYSPSPGTSYSVILRGFGTDIAYSSLPVNGENMTRGALSQIQKSLEVGSTMRYPSEGTSPYLTISIAGEKDFVTKVLRVRGGVEAILMGMLSLRLGYVNAEVRQLRYGAGIAVGRLAFDYAVMPTIGAGRFDELTLKVVF